MHKLTLKELRFITEYLLDFNATQAAIRAGYSARWANKIGPELLKKPHIEDEVNKIKKSILNDHKVTIDRLIDELFKIAFFSSEEETLKIKDLMDPETFESKPGILFRIKQLTVKDRSLKVTFVDRLNAAELLVSLLSNLKGNTNHKVNLTPILERVRLLTR